MCFQLSKHLDQGDTKLLNLLKLWWTDPTRLCTSGGSTSWIKEVHESSIKGLVCCSRMRGLTRKYIRENVCVKGKPNFTISHFCQWVNDSSFAVSIYIYIPVLSRHVTSSRPISTYENAFYEEKAYVKRAFQKYLKQRVTNCNEQLHSVTDSEEYQNCVLLNGRLETDTLFAIAVLHLYNIQEVPSCGGSEDALMRRELLEDFIVNRKDIDSPKLKK